MKNQNHSKENQRQPGDLANFPTILKEELGGLSRSAGYELAKQPDFPKPFKLTKRTVLFSRQAVREFVESRQA